MMAKRDGEWKSVPQPDLRAGRRRRPGPRPARFGSADHHAAAGDLGFAQARVARFQHFGLGKFRFSFGK